jgi:hypothetical protein
MADQAVPRRPPSAASPDEPQSFAAAFLSPERPINHFPHNVAWFALADGYDKVRTIRQPARLRAALAPPIAHRSHHDHQPPRQHHPLKIPPALGGGAPARGSRGPHPAPERKRKSQTRKSNLTRPTHKYPIPTTKTPKLATSHPPMPQRKRRRSPPAGLIRRIPYPGHVISGRAPGHRQPPAPSPIRPFGSVVPAHTPVVYSPSVTRDRWLAGDPLLRRHLARASEQGHRVPITAVPGGRRTNAASRGHADQIGTDLAHPPPRTPRLPAA